MLNPPTPVEVARALSDLHFADAGELPEDLLAFYHLDTLRQICALRKHLLEKTRAGT